MSDSVGSGIQDAAGRGARGGAGGVHDAADEVQRAVCRVRGGIGEVREVIRAQPITAAVVVFALGYLFGRLGSLIPSRRSSAG